MTTGVRWVRMTPEEYAEYRAKGELMKDAWDDGYNKGKCDGYDEGYEDGRNATRQYDEQENDENWND